MNSTYVYMAAASHMGATKNMVQVSAQMKRDVGHIINITEADDFAQLVDDPMYLYLTVKGACSNASGGKVEGKNVWGAHTSTRYVQGRWSFQTIIALKEGKISISPLDLLATIPLLHIVVKDC